MKIIGVGLQKGGVGKTSVLLGLAQELAKTKKVLIVDADPQGNSTCALISDLKFELADVLFSDAEISEAILQTQFNNLYILPTKPVGTRLRKYKISGEAVENQFKIDDELKKVSSFFDYCLIDTSPDFSVFEQNIFFACNEILPVMNCDTFGSDGLTIFLMNIKNFCANRRKSDLQIKTIVLNKFNKTFKTDSEIKKIVEENKDYNYLTIPQDQNIKDCELKQILISGKAETMNAFKELAEAVK